jgi:hypothetical protein
VKGCTEVKCASAMGRPSRVVLVLWLALGQACADKNAPVPHSQDAAAGSAAPVTSPPGTSMAAPVDIWREGRPAGKVDAHAADAAKYAVLDLGDGFTPVLFSDGTGPNGEPRPHAFRPTYLALARGEFPKDAYGERAKEDKYLELYGIMPTLSVLRERLHWAEGLACSKQLDLSALESFKGVVSYQSPEAARRVFTRYLSARKVTERLLQEQGKTIAAELDMSKLKPKDRDLVAFYEAEHDDTLAIEAAQSRLECEGYFKGKGKWVKGSFDWATHEALAEFERRHRVFSWGAIGPETLEALRADTAQVEHETVVRVLTERAMHAFGAIEDGSVQKPDGSQVTFTGADGKPHEVPDLESQLRHAVVRAFGLTGPDATMKWLDSLGPLARDGHLFAAVEGPARPEYYGPDMELSVGIDRGDVWYEFPFDEHGAERGQPVSRRPRTTLFVTYRGQRFPLARFGTTIGGWKSEFIEGQVWWKYKGSPWGEVLWEEIVSAPVWLPPRSTPPRELLKRRPRRRPGESKWVPNYHETGPSYASAYGLVAAYHRRFTRDKDGEIRPTGDEGIRSHGSVDYMSIMRRHSHGCHRLHNHIAVRLFSFVVTHRPHTREGHQPVSFGMDLEYEEEKHHIHIKQGGYAFQLQRPIFVSVDEGRIRGEVRRPIDSAIPKFNAECKAYLLPDGGAVLPKPNGQLVPTAPPPSCDPTRFVEPSASALEKKAALPPA